MPLNCNRTDWAPIAIERPVSSYKPMNDDIISTLLPQNWDERITVCRYVLNHDGMRMPMHVFVVTTERFVVIVDTLINDHTGRQLAAIAQRSLPGRQLLIVNTHADYDHAWGNMAFAEPGPQFAPIIGTRQCAERLRSDADGQSLRGRQQHDPARYGHVRLVPPSLSFDGPFTIDGGDLTLVLLPTPGHTADHCSVWIPEIATLLAGDTAEQPIPFVDASVAQLRASLARLEALEPAITLYCHADTSMGPELLAANSAYFERVEQHCRDALVEGKNMRVADSELEALVGFPLGDVLPEDYPADQRAFARAAHHAAIRATLAELTR